MQTDDTTAHIPIRSRDGSVRAYALIDAADAEWANQWRWHFKRGYAVRVVNDNGKRRVIYLHRELLGLPPGGDLLTDHINRDRLDARRFNLRLVTRGQNAQNVSSNKGSSSQYRGVYWDKAASHWRAAVKVNGQKVHLGMFSDEHEAGEAARSGRARLLPFSVG